MITLSLFAPLKGRMSVAPGRHTGSTRICSNARAVKERCSAASGYRARGSNHGAGHEPRGVEPGLHGHHCRKLANRRPAPHQQDERERELAARQSLREMRAVLPRLPVRPSPRRTALGSACSAWTTGMSPTPTPTNSDITRMKTTTAPHGDLVLARKRHRVRAPRGHGCRVAQQQAHDGGAHGESTLSANS